MKLLVLSPEAIVPPGHGGSLRSAHLICGLARHFETAVLVPQSRIEIEAGIGRNPELRGVDWHSVWEFDRHAPASFFTRIRGCMARYQEERLKRRWKGIYRDWYFGALGSWNRALERVVAEFRPDIVMIEHTRHSATLDIVRRLLPDALLVVDSHNVESELLSQVLDEGLPAKRRGDIIEELENYERALDDRCDVLWSCSTNDMERYRGMGLTRPELGVVPNGVDTVQIRFREAGERSETPTILFAGTLCYEPNEEGIHWFYKQVWPRIKDLVPGSRWQIVGRAPSPAIMDLAVADNRIQIFADVPSMAPFLDSAHVGICPLFSGSGTRLKILEAFSAGLPMVSTRLGAEGIDANPGESIIIADQPVDFAGAVARLLGAPAEAERIRRNARQLAEEHYDWTRITDEAAAVLLWALGRSHKLRS